MAAIPPRTNIDGIKKAVIDGIDGAFERGKKYGRYLALQEYLHQKEESNPKWISVEERLPKDGVRVLALSPKGYNVLHRIGAEWCIETRGYIAVAFDKVTHWMPLPEPPKEDA